ncbi:MAG: mechanosensitive ion channel family protein [Anaerolineae bacterium]|nr:mechanosensitive ion channel family protein [Anaerolineae bacterium]
MIELDFLRSLSPEVRYTIIRVLLALVTVLVIWLLRSALTWLIFQPIRAFIERRQNGGTANLVVDSLELPIRILVVALGTGLAAAILETDRTTNTFVSHLTRTLVIVGIATAVYNLSGLITNSSPRLRTITGISIDEQLIPFLKTVLRILIIIFAGLIILQEWQFDISALIAGLGVGTLGISLAAQDTVANLFAFSTIVSDRPFVVGEYIKTPDVEGIVDRVGSRTTRIRQLDQAFVTVPNSKLANDAIVNWSRLTKRRLDFVLGVTYSTSAAQMRVLVAQIRDLLVNHEKVNPESVIVHFVNFGDSALQIRIIAEAYEPNWGAFQGFTEEINLQVMEIVENLGLSMAFPSRSLYIENMAFAPGENGQLRLETDSQERLDSKPVPPLPDAEPNRSIPDGPSEGEGAPDD